MVEPGVVSAKFAAAVEAKRLFYPPDPGSQAVSALGGNVAENAGGLRGLRYGVTRDYVMGLEFFDVNGELVKAGVRTVKCVTGYNLGGLLVGSEGTLGVFDKITLKLIPMPPARKAMMAEFKTSTEATREPWPTLADLLTEDEERRVEKLAEKTMDLIQLLVDILHVQAGKAPEGVRGKNRHDTARCWRRLGVLLAACAHPLPQTL